MSGFANAARLPPTCVSGHHKLRVIEATGWPRPRFLGSRSRDWPGLSQQPRSSADRFVSRPALLERLSAAAPGTVTLVCAPAGSGKTVLLRSWAAETDAAVAWVTVERGERDAQRFWLHVIDALADAAGDEVIERVSPAPQLRRRAGGRATPGPARAARGAARAGDRRPARARLRRRARVAGDAAHAAAGTAAGRARDARGAGARPAPPEARGRAGRTARRPTCASRSTKAARCSGPAASRCRIPGSARCTNAPRDGRPVCAWRRSR